MEMAELRAMLAQWENLGPFREIEDLRQEMHAAANASGSSLAPLLVGALLTFSDSVDPQLGTLQDFLAVYSSCFPDVLAAAIVPHLSTDGPPALVEVLGGTGARSAIPALRAHIDIMNASDDLVVALAGALGEIGGAAAADWLRELSAREGISQAARDEVAIALDQLSLDAGAPE